MKKINLFAASFSILTATQALGFQTSEEAIRSQLGCFRVEFEFEEILKDGTHFRNYKDEVIEWVSVSEDSVEENGSRNISLVHILTAAKGHFIMKHWRETWTKNPTHIWEYQGERRNYAWQKRALNPMETTDRWTQTIHHIHDGPNRACEGIWEHAGTSKWNCTTLTPTTRRDWKRTDIEYYQYNAVNYYSPNQFFIGGTIHKYLGREEVSTETGGGTYTRIDESNCVDAKNWWQNNQSGWNNLSNTWKQIYQNSSTISLKNPSLENWRTNWRKLYRAATEKDQYISWAATQDWSSWVSPSAWYSWTKDKISGAAENSIENLILEDWEVR